MVGTIKDLLEILILYEDIDTTGGNSGSPVFEINENGIKSIIGVHVAASRH